MQQRSNGGPGARAYVLQENEGKAIWFANTLMVVKTGSEMTEGRFALLDQRLPGGFAPPRHIHHVDDEAWYILEGEATFYCGGEQFQAGRGAWVFLPKAVPHSFKVGPVEARMLTLSAPAGFAEYVEECGEPAPELVIPPQGPLDIDKLARVAAKHQIEIIGPPPD